MFSYLTPSWSRDIVNCLRDKDMTSFSTLAEVERQNTTFKSNIKRDKFKNSYPVSGRHPSL